MKQSEIWRAYLDPIVGSEQGGLRPVVIISGNILNVHLNVLIVCPLTSKVKNYEGHVVLEPNSENGLSVPSEILNFHVRSISKERLVKKIGNISKEELEQTKKGLNEILTY
ncbi:MAG: type II toxin-antitoxin system PemK/MazF family toxin [Flavobacteriales bacterium]|jgi:mRNA interferase MazF|nr:type II toxin-antitoxin system PemK/MazF family toxin [Flavobacteriales bacterium]